MRSVTSTWRTTCAGRSSTPACGPESTTASRALPASSWVARSRSTTFGARSSRSGESALGNQRRVCDAQIRSEQEGGCDEEGSDVGGACGTGARRERLRSPKWQLGHERPEASRALPDRSDRENLAQGSVQEGSQLDDVDLGAQRNRNLSGKDGDRESGHPRGVCEGWSVPG